MLFIDADALAKLAHWQILPILPTITGMTWNRMATISSLKHRAHRASTKPDGRLFHCPHAAAVSVR